MTTYYLMKFALSIMFGELLVGSPKMQMPYVFSRVESDGTFVSHCLFYPKHN